MNNTKTYSKKQANTIITNAIMKMILMNKNIEKKSIKQYLMSNNINESLITYFDNLKRSQFKSLKDYANKQIQKFNYTHEAEIILDEYNLPNYNNQNTKNEILLTLISFKLDNANIKF